MATKVIKGTKDTKGAYALRGPRDSRQLRCKTCYGLAVQVPDGKGGFVYQCQGCQKQYKSISL